MEDLSKLPETPELYGIYQRTIDEKGRVIIPMEWSEVFGAYSHIIILNAGSYLIIMPESGYKHSNDSDIIPIKITLDNSRRVTIGQNIQENFGLELEGFAGLIGKGNHIELYLQEKVFKDSSQRSMDAVRAFQVSLIARLEKNNLT